MELERGMDFRLPEYRREVFLRFFLFHCKHRSHPGCVYYLMPWLREHYGWNDEQALWYAFLNGNTQHPITSLLLFSQCEDPTDLGAVLEMVRFYNTYYRKLAFDTDRRHWKNKLPKAVMSYRRALRGHGGSQREMWLSAAESGFAGVWAQATGLYGFGRLSAFSYAEYLKLMGVPFECDNLFLGDIDGSRSHRNGLLIVDGQDEVVLDKSLSTYTGGYTSESLANLGALAADLLAEAQERAARQAQGGGHVPVPHPPDGPERTGEPSPSPAHWSTEVHNFTLESALCTYKSWHKPNRRYPGVYNDMLYDRLRRYEAVWPEAATAVFWQAREECLPAWLRLEETPYDPGCAAVKQNWYRDTGEVPVMGREDGTFWSGFDAGVDDGEWGLRRDLKEKVV